MVSKSRESRIIACSVTNFIHKISVKLCAAIADYLETSHACMEEMLDSGLAREAETYSLGILKHTLCLGLPVR